jgi:ribonuclease P protein component
LIGRISDRRTFEQLARAGRSFRTRVLWCRYLSDPKATPLRVAFAVGRSYGRATERNRLRRRLRAIVSAEAARCDVHSGWLLIGARPTAKEHTFDELSADVHRLMLAVSSTS